MSFMTAWPLQYSPQELAAWLNKRLDGTLMGPMGIRAVAISAERGVAELAVTPQVATPTGHVHAGATVALADTTATWTTIAALGGDLTRPSDFPLATNISCQLIGNIQEGTLLAESKIVHQGRTLVIVETRVSSDSGRLLALVTTTHFIRRE